MNQILLLEHTILIKITYNLARLQTHLYSCGGQPAIL